MKCPVCGSSSIDFQADRLTCMSCGESVPSSKMLDLIGPIGDWLKGDSRSASPAKRNERGLGDAPVPNAMDLVTDLNVAIWRIVGEVMATSVESVRRYGERFDEMDAGRDGRMRDHLGRTIREQFDLDLESAACCLAATDGKVTPEELAIVNGALGLDLDEAAVRQRAAAANADGGFFSALPQSFVAAVVYDNLAYAETRNADDSCSELLLRTLKTLCEEMLICDGDMGDEETSRFTSLMTTVQDLLVEKLDSWGGKPRVSALALSPSYGDSGVGAGAANATADAAKAAPAEAAKRRG